MQKFHYLHWAVAKKLHKAYIWCRCKTCLLLPIIAYSIDQDIKTFVLALFFTCYNDKLKNWLIYLCHCHSTVLLVFVWVLGQQSFVTNCHKAASVWPLHICWTVWQVWLLLLRTTMDLRSNSSLERISSSAILWARNWRRGVKTLNKYLFPPLWTSK